MEQQEVHSRRVWLPVRVSQDWGSCLLLEKQTPEEIQCWTRDHSNVSVLSQRTMKSLVAVILLNLFVSANLHNGIFVYFLLFCNLLFVCFFICVVLTLRSNKSWACSSFQKFLNICRLMCLAVNVYPWNVFDDFFIDELIDFYSSINLAVCVRPKLHANIDVKGLQRFYNPGSTVVLTCMLGFVPILGPRKIVCSDSGEWSKTSIQCIGRHLFIC